MKAKFNSITVLSLRVVVLCCIMLVSLSTTGYALDQISFVPTSHPRIWLTDGELARLRAARAAGSPQWSALETWCDAHLSDTGYDARNINWKDYRGNGYEDYLYNYSLGYQVLKESDPGKASAYAALVRNIVIDGIIKGFKVGEEDNGLAYIRSGEADDRTVNSSEASLLGLSLVGSKLGYTSRSLASVAIAYDWIYDTLSSSDRDLIRNNLLRWVDWTRGKRSVYNNGVLVAGTRYYEDRDGNCTGADICTSITNVKLTKGYDYGAAAGNFMSGHFYMSALAILAVHGEYPESDSYWQYLRDDLFNNIVKAQFNSVTGHKGGDSVEGWNYGSGLWRYLKAIYGLNTATGANFFSEFDFPQDCLKANIHRLAPNLKDVPIYGTWTGVPLGENRRYVTLPIVGINRKLSGDTTEVQVGQYLLDKVKTSDPVELWDELLWYEPGKPTLPPSNMPLSYRAIGDGFVTSRDSWDPDATMISARLAGRWLIDKESYDQGSITLQRGDDRLLTHKSGVVDSQGSNTVVFNENKHYPNNNPLTSPAIDREEDGAGYYYVSGDISNAWKKMYNVDRAKLFRRSIVHLRSGKTVIYDVTRSNTAVGVRKGWYTNYIAAPSIDGDIISATVGASKVFVRTLYPVGGAFTTTQPNSGYWRVRYEPAVQQEYERFLHVIEATAANSTGMTSTRLINSSDGKMIGSFMDGADSAVVMFSADPDGKDVVGDVAYTLPLVQGKVSQHLLANLAPNTEYTLAVVDNGAAGRSYQLTMGSDPAKGAVYRSSGQGVLKFREEAPAPIVVEVTSPANDSLIRELSTVNISATGGEIKKVELYIDDVLAETLSVSPFEASWDTSSYAAGLHTLQAKAFGSTGAVQLSKKVQVTVEKDTTAPVATITAPANGSAVQGNVTVNISASDNFAVAKVELYLNGQLYAVVGSPAALTSIKWDTLASPNGSYSLTAKAYDKAGNLGESAALTVTVANDTVLPTVSIASPTSGGTLKGTVALSIDATDNVGVSMVEFYVNGKLVSTWTAAPYAMSWNTEPYGIGTCTLTAKAYDAAGNAGVSSTVTVDVYNDIMAPAVAIASPVAGSTVGGTVAVSATANDNVGVTKVEFYVNGALKVTDTTAPYSFNWSTKTLENGSYTVSAKAYDAAGNIGESVSAVTVFNDTTAPTVAIVSPVASATASGSLVISANASDDVAVTKVDFFVNGVFKDSSISAPFTINWNTIAIANGTYTVYAKAYDKAGNVGQSATVTFTVFNDKVAPTVSLASPAISSTVKGSVVVSANASDNVAVKKVDFYVNGALKASSVTAPYNFAWNTLAIANGSYTVTAKAYDTSGNATMSAGVAVTVANDPAAPIPAP